MPKPSKCARPNGLRSDPHNARRHPERNKALIRKSLEEIGGFRSIGVDGENIVRAGNGVLEQAQALGLKIRIIDAKPDELIAVRRPDLKGKRAVRAALLDNRTSEMGEWDTDVLAGLDGEFLDGLWELEEFDVLLQNNGITPEEFQDPEPQIDRAGELQQKWKTEQGQLWLIPSKTVPGKAHRLLCGDSTKAEDVARLMGGKRAEIVVADPPYGINLDTDWSDVVGSSKSIGRQHRIRGGKYERVIGDARPFDPESIFRSWGYCSEILLFGADYYADRIPRRAKGSWLVWDKRKPSQAEAIGSEFELCWSKAKHKRSILRHDWFGFLSSANGSDARNRQHPTQKPVTLIGDLLQKFSKSADLVCDPYAGSGTTLIAAEQLGRLCYGMEISEKYVAVALERLAGMGLTPRLVESGANE